MIEFEATAIVYRNPKPYLRAIDAPHPSLARLDDGWIKKAMGNLG